MYKEDVALNNLKWFICHKTKPNQTQTQTHIYMCMYATDRVLYTGQIELYYVLMLNWIVWNRTVYMYKNGFGIK